MPSDVGAETWNPSSRLVITQGCTSSAKREAIQSRDETAGLLDLVRLCLHRLWTPL